MENSVMKWLPSLKPRTKLPFYVLTAGYSKITGSLWKDTIRPQGNDPALNIYWVLEGKVAFELKKTRQKYVLKKNQIFFLYPGEICSRRLIDESGWMHWWLSLNGPLMEAMLKNFNLYEKRIINIEMFPEFLFKELIREMDNLSETAEFRASSLAYQILVWMAEHLNRPKTTSRELEIVRQCEKIIAEAYSDPELSVQYLAAEFDLNRFKLSRIFRKTKGITLHEYILNFRLKSAISLLGNKELSIKEIALKSGFEDPAYFSRFIKKYTGVAPQFFRKLMDF